MVLWGNADVPAVRVLLDRLAGWTVAYLSSPQWGTGDVAKQPTDVSVHESIQPGHPIRFYQVAVVTKVVRSFVRIHARVFESFGPDPDWGHIALIGSHFERIGLTGKPWPPIWHIVEDWHVGRDQLTNDLSQLLGRTALAVQRLPTQGIWQRRYFDGDVVFFSM
jgi:hypothetical protein